MFISYEKNGSSVWVRKDLKDRQKEYCICWSCARFRPEAQDKGCPIVKRVLDEAAELKIVLPVWECGQFQERIS